MATNNKRFELLVEVISDVEDAKVQRSFNPATQQYTYVPIIQRELLDTYGEDNVSLNYSIADIADISSKTSSYSKTIKLPATDRNRRVFTQCSAIGADNSFNSKRFTKCYVMVETLIVFEGYIQLNNYTFNGQYGEFEVVLRDVPVGFFNALGESRLQDLDWASLSHIWDETNIKNTWDNTKSYEYYYPLMDPGMNIQSQEVNKEIGYKNIYNSPRYSTSRNGISPASSYPSAWVENFYPGVYLRAYIDRIFAAAGYRYKSNFFSSDLFGKMFIPYSGPRNIPCNNVDYTGQKTLAYDRQFKIGCAGPMMLTNNVAAVPSLVKEFNLPFNDRTSPGRFDPNYRWDTSNYFNQNNSMDVAKVRFKIGLQLIGTPLTESDTTITKIEVVVYRELPNSTAAVGTIPSWNNGTGWTVHTFCLKDTSSSPVKDIVTPTWLTIAQTPLAPTPGLEVELITPWLDNPSWRDFLNAPSGLTTDKEYIRRGALKYQEHLRVNVRFTTTTNTHTYYLGSNAYITNEVATETIYKGRMDIDRVVPQNVRCQDFMKSMINMFNLHIEASKDDEYLLNIEPRDDYFDLGKKVDWSDKVDLSREVKLDILANTQSRRNIFKFTDGVDYSNSNYQAIFGEPYGSYTFDSGSQQTSSKTEIVSLFQPSPLVPYHDNVYWVNATEKISDGKIYNGYPDSDFKAQAPRLLFAEKHRITNVNAIRFMGFDLIDSNNSYFYPYAGPLDNLFYPTYDLNFGLPSGVYYDTLIVNATNNNLFEMNWRTMMEELSHKDSRLVTLYMKLSPSDIANFTFNTKIFLAFSHPNADFSAGGYFKVNAINDYNPSSDDPCKVELLKTDYI